MRGVEHQVPTLAISQIRIVIVGAEGAGSCRQDEVAGWAARHSAHVVCSMEEGASVSSVRGPATACMPTCDQRLPV